MVLIAILCYKNPLVGKWGPEDIKTGLPGSEEAVVYVSDVLKKRGVDLHIYANPKTPDETWKDADLWSDPNNTNMYDCVILWRIYNSKLGRPRSKYVFFWGHDSPSSYSELRGFDGCFVLSKHHETQYEKCLGFSTTPRTISGNGVVMTQFQGSKEKQRHSVGYFSNYARGLRMLVKIWPKIKIIYPDATLSICYGRETWGSMEPRLHKELIETLETYSKTMDVIEYGKVGHEELAKIMEQTSVWAYPCNTYAETFCITAVKCQLAECIPVCTRIGALDEVLHPEAPLKDTITHQDDFCNALLNALETEDGHDRCKYSRYASQYTWDAVVDKWFGLIRKITENDEYEALVVNKSLLECHEIPYNKQKALIDWVKTLVDKGDKAIVFNNKNMVYGLNEKCKEVQHVTDDYYIAKRVKLVVMSEKTPPKLIFDHLNILGFPYIIHPESNAVYPKGYAVDKIRGYPLVLSSPKPNVP